MKKLVSILLCTALMLGISACGTKTNPKPGASTGDDVQSSAPEHSQKLLYVHGASDTSILQETAVHFKEVLEEKSGGRLHMDVFHSAQLASDRDCIEGMQMNTIQSGIMVGSALAGFTDELLVFDLPFLFESSEQGLE